LPFVLLGPERDHEGEIVDWPNSQRHGVPGKKISGASMLPAILLDLECVGKPPHCNSTLESGLIAKVHSWKPDFIIDMTTRKDTDPIESIPLREQWPAETSL
jgi:hypothetical protein